MTPSQPGSLDPFVTIERLIDEVGVAKVVSTLAQLSAERSDRLMSEGDRIQAVRYMQAFRALEKALQLMRA